MKNTDGDTLASSLWEQAGGDALLDAAEDAGLLSGVAEIPDTTDILWTLDGRNVFVHIRDSLFSVSGGMLAHLGTLLGLLLLCALWQKYRAARNGGDGGLLSTVSAILIALVSMEWFAALLDDTLMWFSSIHTQMTAALTALLSLSAMRGMVTTASVTGAGMAFFLAVCECITGSVLPVFLRLCAGLSLASAVGGDSCAGLDGLSGLLRRQFLWLTGALMTILCAVLSCQNVLARSADSVSGRAVKFALSGVIPVVGGAVGDAASTVSAGFSLVSETVGVLGVALILWQILPPLITLLLTRVVYSAGAVFASAIGFPRGERILSECASLVGFLCGVTAAEGLCYLLMLILCMKGGS